MEEARALVDAGADVNAKDSDNQTPLHRAVLYERVETVKGLFAFGANVNTKDQTPLHHIPLPQTMIQNGIFYSTRI